MLALAATMAKLGDHPVSIGQQSGAEFGIVPGAGDKAGPDLRTNIALIKVDDGVQRGRVDQPFFDQNCLQRLHPKRGFGRQKAVRIVIVMVMRHGVILRRFAKGCPEGNGDLKMGIAFPCQDAKDGGMTIGKKVF